MTVKIEISACSMAELAQDLRALGIVVDEALHASLPETRHGEKDCRSIAWITTETIRTTDAIAAKLGDGRDAEVKEPAKRRGRPAKAAQETAAAPTTKEDAQQDAADEAAETAANQEEGDAPTLDTLRHAMGRYVEAYGGPAAQQDRAAIFKSGLGDPPEGEDIWLFSKIGEMGDSSLLIKAIHAWEEATKTNPFNRERIA